MRVLTDIGEVGITAGERQVKFRPSLDAMARLGSPEEIVEKFVALHQPPPVIEHMPWDKPGAMVEGDKLTLQIFRRHWRDMLFLSWEVLTACCDEDIADIIGEPGEKYGSYRIRQVQPEIMLALARSLMHYGCIGNAHSQDKGKSSAGEYSRAFDPMQYVTLAVTHLGMAEADAWNLTITSFQAHWEAKHGKQKERRYVDEHESTMKWLASINAMRDANPWKHP